MKPFRLLLLIMAGCCFLGSEPAWAQATAAAYIFPKQFSSDAVVTTKDGRTVTMKTYSDNGKIRIEMTMNGMGVISIVRPDQQKMYTVMAAQKMVMAMPLDPERVKQMMPPGSGGDGTITTVGPDIVNGVATIKYKMTNGQGKVSFIWVNPATQAPVKLTSEDGSTTVAWTSFQAGPQDAALFEPPADYQVMNMPTAPSAPGGPPPGSAPWDGFARRTEKPTEGKTFLPL